jgi:exopolysaccharide production protein ExoZ
VISGFIMWVTTANAPRPSPGSFWRSRVARIVPLYWFCTVAYIAVAMLIPTQLFHAAFASWHIVASFLFIPAEHPDGDIVPIYTLGWTLNYEMFFYFVFGLCLLVRSEIVRLATLSASLFGFVLIGAITMPKSAIGLFYTDPIILEFLAGVLVGAAFLKFNSFKVLEVAGYIAMAVSVAAYVGLYLGAAPRLIAFGLPSALCVAGAVVAEMGKRRGEFRFGSFLGDCSYSIYLAHPFVLRPIFIVASAVLVGPTRLSQVILALVCVAAGIGGGIMSFIVIEQPLGRRARGWLGLRDSPSAQATGVDRR